MSSNNAKQNEKELQAHRKEVRAALEGFVNKTVCVSWSAIPNRTSGETTCVTINGTLEQHPDNPWLFRCVGAGCNSFAFFDAKDVVCLDKRTHRLDLANPEQNALADEFVPVQVEAIISIYRAINPVEALASLAIDDLAATLGIDLNDIEKEE